MHKIISLLTVLEDRYSAQVRAKEHSFLLPYFFWVLFQLFIIHYLLIFCVSQSVPHNRRLIMLSVMSICVNCTTEIVSAESQEGLTDCGMEIDRIVNVQKGKWTKTDILCKMC